MSSDDQHFLDVLSSIPNHILHYSLDVTESLERHFDSVAGSTREYLYHASWLPDSIRPVRPPPPPQTIFFPVEQDGVFGYAEWVLQCLNRNRAITAATVAFFGTGGYLYWSQRRAYMRKRRAGRGAGGSRKEVVIVAGTMHSPVTRSVVLDLERRGFIVYVIVESVEEANMVKSEGKADILPLKMNVTDPHDVKDIMTRFNNLFSTPPTPTSASPSAATTAHLLKFSGLLLVPSFSYPTGPLETLSSNLWSSNLNTKLLAPIATANAFLRTMTATNSRIIVVTPTIASSLMLPFNGVEAAVVAGLDGWVGSLRSEINMAAPGTSVVQIKVGNMDVGAFTEGGSRMDASAGEGQVMAWEPAAREAYAQRYMQQRQQQKDTGTGKVVKGSNVRELHNAVFDALTQGRPRAVWRVGSGSLVYEVLGRWMPSPFVRWMMGSRRRADGGRVA